RRDARLGASAVIASRRPSRRGAGRGNARVRAEGRGRREAVQARPGRRRPQAVRSRRGMSSMARPRDLMTATLRFGQMLRAAGLPVTVSEVMDAVRALNVVDLMDRGEVYLALRTVLVARVEEMPLFDRCFDAFWKFQADEGQGLEGLVTATPTAKQEEEALP